MSQVNPKELHPEVWKLFDRYVHGLIDRRGFLDGTAKYAVGGMTAVGILEALAPELRRSPDTGAAERFAHQDRADRGQVA